ncbi:MAG: hypothetical protein JXA43_00280 [Candidatus Diapherotrites archaeon]|nr:hypothetical protein [Candidatus Diapherotrites archaeon]
MNKLLVLSFLIVVVIAATSMYFLFFVDPYENYNYIYREKGAVFVSNEAPPVDLIHSYQDKPRFIIITRVDDTEYMPYIAQVLVTLAPVATANEKNAIIVSELYEGNEMVSCSTNRGNVTVVDTLTGEECRDYLDDFGEDTVRIIFDIPNKMSNDIVVYVSPNELRAVLRQYEEMPEFAKFVSSAIFENTEEVLKKMNELAAHIGSAQIQ